MKIKIFYLLVVLLSIGFSMKSYCQLTVDVGRDTTYCADIFTSEIQMGLKVKVENGTAPYSYAWECTVGSIKPIHAGVVLADSTQLSPAIVNGAWHYTDEKVKFILNVTDQEKNHAKDSLYVDFSVCNQFNEPQVIYLNKGDSLLLRSIIPQGKFAAWYRSIDDDLPLRTDEETWIKPQTNTDIFLTSIDTFGCSCRDYEYELRVTPTSIDETHKSVRNIEVKQWGTGIRFHNADKKMALVSVFSVDGKLIYQTSSAENHVEIDSFLPNKRLFFVKVVVDGKMGVCKYLKN